MLNLRYIPLANMLLQAIGLLIFLTGSRVYGVRVCVTGDAGAVCDSLRADAADLDITCVPSSDRYECLRRVAEKEADVMRADAEDVYLARELYDTQVHVIAETRTIEEQKEPGRYDGVALVRRSAIKSLEDLRGSKSCHTGYGRTAGWSIPFSHLLELGQIQLNCQSDITVVEHDLKAASSYFGLACIPGRWVPDDKTNAKLKAEYNNLCTMCGDPGRCDDQDVHAGYEGALRCLVDSHGDVAWTKRSAVSKFFKKRTSVATSDYGLLCPDGRVLDVDTTEQCRWATRPWTSWLTRSNADNQKDITVALTKLMESASPPLNEGATLKPWAKYILGTEVPSVIHTLSPPVTPFKFLNEAGYDTTIDRLGCPEKPVRLCVDSRMGRDKCLALQQVLKSRRIRPTLECVVPTAPDDCLAMLAAGNADITAVDGGDTFRGHTEYGIYPVVAERYGLLDASYFAVAVVKANSGITSISQLHGKKSCHTGIDKTAGWKIPVVTLLEAGLIQPGNCDFAGEIGKFFSQSCAPGAKDSNYDPQGTNPDSLCDLCIGNDVKGVSGPTYAGGNLEGKCKRSHIEAFYGYTGAFRCLVQGGGDVAFVKHTTVAENTNGNSNASWTEGLRALDFRLLCKGNGAADVADYNTCHLARVPAHKVVTGIRSNPVMVEEIRILLLRASQQLSKGQDIFTMFGPYHGRPDVIFKDSATELVNLPEDAFHKSIDNIYYRALSELSTCSPKDSPQRGPYSPQTYNEAAAAPSLHYLLAVTSAAITWAVAR
ncbi:transferrin-like [Penaeus chinensis]|uniref:transferrin-like n=1 Tax=Penaeus chinensis TaxID=139456 RepID=UPI001FB7E567|nr:transferrin-like [Penaeus chinensis]